MMLKPGPALGEGKTGVALLDVMISKPQGGIVSLMIETMGTSMEWFLMLMTRGISVSAAVVVREEMTTLIDVEGRLRENVNESA